MDEWMEMTDKPEDFITFNDLYNYYCDYCTDELKEKLGKDAFAKALRKAPYNYNCKERKKKKNFR